jgi:pyruvate/2-oxoglutarate dehydrogenase complex dihydrolipoamide acyltransferase (E2) component
MNYNIENGLNFYETLKQTIASHDSETNEQEGICPISNTPLETYFFTFECGHKFNYAPLFKDIYNHKKKYNFMEGVRGHLNMNQIRCPFCRKKQNGLLPYYSELPFEKVHGVNYINPDITEVTHGLPLLKCQFIINPPETDGTINKCLSNGHAIIAGCCLCYEHYMKHKQAEKQKIKAAQHAAKVAAQQAAKVAAQQAAKDAKVAAQQAAKDAKVAAQQAAKDAKVAAQQAAKDAKVAAQQAAKDAKVAAKQAAKDAKVAAKSVKK